MPQVDLEALVSVCGANTSDRKVACEPTADDNTDNISDVPPDLPPESFWLSKDAEFDWFDRNAFLERKESTRGNSNAANSNHSNSNSQRFSHNLKNKAGILGLPKTQKNNYGGDKRRHCKPPNIRLFPPKRSESVGKSTAAMAEPSSPKVSCMGRVRSKRGRRRRASVIEDKTVSVTPPEKTKSADGDKRRGFCAALMSLFRSDHRRRDKSVCSRNDPSAKSSRKSKSIKKCGVPMSDEVVPAAEPPGLGGMTRFVSGRRSESWAAEEMDVARRDSVDSITMMTRSRSTRRG